MRDVPDFLAHLRRDRRGLPVPYVNHGWVEGPLEALSRDVLPAMWAKVALVGKWSLQAIGPLAEVAG